MQLESISVVFARVNSCVCFDNYKLFVLLVSYSGLLSLFVAVTSLQYVIKFFNVSSSVLLTTDSLLYYLLSSVISLHH